MKSLSVLTILFLSLCSIAISQNSITIKGESISDAYINSVVNHPDGRSPSLIAAQWTYGGYDGYGRSLIKFDLSEIPVFSKVDYAKLSLYHDPISNHIGHSDLGGDNTGIIMRVVQDWVDEEVIWDTQPLTTNTNWRLIHPPDSSNQDYTDIDVTKLIQDMVNHPDLQQGLMIKLLEENVLYRSLVFASVDHTDPELWPELYVEFSDQYQVSEVLTIKPGPEKGKDAYINKVNGFPEGDGESLIASVWTYYGELGTGRFLIDFQLPEIPGDKELIRAELNLFHNPSSAHKGHSKLGGSNELVIQRITEPWDEHTVYWNNQPQTTSENETNVNPSNLEDQHYLNIDITKLVKDILANPDEGYGLLVKLAEEDTMYRSAVFASSDHTNSSLWPSLDLYFGSTTNDIFTLDQLKWKVYPNPNSGKFKIEFNCAIDTPVEAQVFDKLGRLVKEFYINDQVSVYDWSTDCRGMYLIRLNTKNNSIVKKVVIN